MACRFAKVSEEEIEEAFFFYPSDLVNTKTTIPLRVGEELHVSVHIHHYSPPLWRIVVYYYIDTSVLLGFLPLRKNPYVFTGKNMIFLCVKISANQK